MFLSLIIFDLFFLMIRRPPRSTRTDTLFPYTTLFRSDRRSARLQPFENLAFCVGNGLLRRKEFAVSGSNPCDDRHMGTHKAGESGKLPRMVHAHFEHAVTAVGGHAAPAARPATALAVPFDRGLDPARPAPSHRHPPRLLRSRPPAAAPDPRPTAA